MPRPDRGLDNRKIWEFFDKRDDDMNMWSGIERFDAKRFLINGTPTYAPDLFNHNDRVLNQYKNYCKTDCVTWCQIVSVLFDSIMLRNNSCVTIILFCRFTPCNCCRQTLMSHSKPWLRPDQFAEKSWTKGRVSQTSGWGRKRLLKNNENLTERENQDAFAFVRNHFILIYYRHWNEFFLGSFLALFLCCLQFIIL